MAPEHEKTYKFKVDDKMFDSDKAIVTGAEIKQKASVQASFQLFLEVPGEAHPDRQISDTEPVNLAEPGVEKFYTVPPATFGKR
jgi:hypothetical protein